MSFHITNLGSFGGGLSRFADLDGYVPEKGDHYDDLRWDSATEWDDESWDEFVSEAVAALEEAGRALAAWRAA